MKTKAEILEAVKTGNNWKRESCSCLDSRDYSRLIDYFDVGDWGIFGYRLKEGAEYEPIEFTETNIVERMKSDLAFAFEKARGQRGISASLMHDVMKMWMWILDDELGNEPDEFYDYGIGYLQRIAKKYNVKFEEE